MIRVEQSRQWTQTQYWQVFKVHCQYHYCHHRSVNHSQRHCSILLKALLGSGNRERYRCEAEGADRKTSRQSRPKSGGQTRTIKVNRKYINLTKTTGDELCFIQSFQFLSFFTVLMAFAAFFFIVSPRFIHQCIWKKKGEKHVLHSNASERRHVATRGCDSATLQRFTDSFFFTAGAKLIKHFNRVGTESESLLEKSNLLMWLVKCSVSVWEESGSGSFKGKAALGLIRQSQQILRPRF